MGEINLVGQMGQEVQVIQLIQVDIKWVRSFRWVRNFRWERRERKVGKVGCVRLVKLDGV